MATGKYREWLEEDKLTLLKGWARDGLTDVQIADKIHIAVGTLYRWKREYEPIASAIKKGKEVIDYEAEQALIKNAMGFYYDETNTYVDDSGRQKVIKVRKYSKPDTTALIFWLKNRKPEEWRDRRNIEMDARVEAPDLEEYKKILKSDVEI